jgi:hypothetical protein
VQNRQHEWDDDAVCVRCGFDGAEWWHWRHNTYEGKAADGARQPLCTAAYSKDRDSYSNAPFSGALERATVAEWTGLEPATPGVTGRSQK